MDTHFRSNRGTTKGDEAEPPAVDPVAALEREGPEFRSVLLSYAAGVRPPVDQLRQGLPIADVSHTSDVPGDVGVYGDDSKREPTSSGGGVVHKVRRRHDSDSDPSGSGFDGRAIGRPHVPDNPPNGASLHGHEYSGLHMETV